MSLREATVYDFTPDEPFTRTPKVGHPYAVAIEWAVEHLGGSTPLATCLVVGSALAEAEALADRGWHVTYLDHREVPWAMPTVTVRQGNVLALPFFAETFDAISTTCVYCHVGLGRYGDPVQEDAELTMLRECRRVLRGGGRMAMMTGPCIVGEPVTMDTTHRVTEPNRVALTALDAHFGLRDWAAFIPTEKRWRSPDEPWATNPLIPDYLCVALEAV